jgi:hypothetical protein
MQTAESLSLADKENVTGASQKKGGQPGPLFSFYQSGCEAGLSLFDNARKGGLVECGDVG